MKEYSKMTDEEVQKALKQICRAENNKEGIIRRLESEMGYTGRVSFSTVRKNSVVNPVTMLIVMIHGPSGRVIQV